MSSLIAEVRPRAVMSFPSLLYLVASLLLVAVSVAHSVLGERYILGPLLRKSELPRLFGGTEFTGRTLRFAWHLTSISWIGAGALFFSMAQRPLTTTAAAKILAFIFLTSAIITAIASRGRHLAWIVFLAIGLIAYYGAQA